MGELQEGVNIEEESNFFSKLIEDTWKTISSISILEIFNETLKTFEGLKTSMIILFVLFSFFLFFFGYLIGRFTKGKEGIDLGEINLKFQKMSILTEKMFLRTQALKKLRIWIFILLFLFIIAIGAGVGYLIYTEETWTVFMDLMWQYMSALLGWILLSILILLLITPCILNNRIKKNERDYRDYYGKLKDNVKDLLHLLDPRLLTEIEKIVIEEDAIRNADLSEEGCTEKCRAIKKFMNEDLIRHQALLEKITTFVWCKSCFKIKQAPGDGEIDMEEICKFNCVSKFLVQFNKEMLKFNEAEKSIKFGKKKVVTLTEKYDRERKRMMQKEAQNITEMAFVKGALKHKQTEVTKIKQS
jgi:hypothetical protein